jgi:hypothetical protein
MNDIMIVELKQRERNKMAVEEGGFVYDGSDDEDESEDLDDAGAPETPSTDMDDDIPF